MFVCVQPAMCIVSVKYRDRSSYLLAFLKLALLICVAYCSCFLTMQELRILPLVSKVPTCVIIQFPLQEIALLTISGVFE